MRLTASLLGPTLALVTACVTGCGGGASTSTPPATAPKTEPAAAAPAPASPAVKTVSLRRANVRETIASGLGMFLQNVAVDDWPVMKSGRFYGFRIRAINPEWGVDLKPGDVVTRVNGMPIEHPEDADAALRSLEKATALKVDYERDGATRTLELPILDD